MNSDTGCLEAQFEQDKTGTYISEHYIFHFRPDSLAEKDIFLIAKIQEQSFQKICRTLRTDYGGNFPMKHGLLTTRRNIPTYP